MIIAVTGTPCTGKTVVSKKIAETLGYRYIDVGEFAEKYNLIIEEDAERETKIVDEKKLKKLLKHEDDVVIDGHYSEIVNSDIVFVLRCPPKILKERLLKKFSPEKVKENLLAEILDSCLISAAENNDNTTVFEIENISTEKTVEKILTLIRNKKIEESIAFKPTCKYLNDENLNLL